MSDTKTMHTPQTRIALSEPVFSGNEWSYVRECIDTRWVSSAGAFVTRFEEACAVRTGASYAVATVNGTAALHLAFLAVGVQPGDLVLVPTVTFIATANAVRYCGASPVFMDCEATTMGMDPEKVATFLATECRRDSDGATRHRVSGRRVAAIVPVHVFGHPVDMDPIVATGAAAGVPVVEDATESLGSRYRGRPLGAIGDVGCLSFNGNKIVTAGGGGMVVTNHRAFAERIRHLSTQAKSNDVTSDHDAVGFNYRLTNIQAALGLAQLEQLDTFVVARRQHRERYGVILADVHGITMFRDAPWAASNAWLTTIRVADERAHPLVAHLRAAGIEARPVWKLLHTLPMYRDDLTYALDVAPRLQPRCLSLPSSVNLTTADIDRVVAEIRKVAPGDVARSIR